MPDVRGFQLWLLSKMRADDLVAAAVDGFGLSVEEMRKEAARIATAHRLGNIVHPADIYSELLGAPESTRDDDVETDGTLTGSTSRAFRLPLWPSALFVVNRHPAGYMSSIGFEPGTALPAGDPIIIARSVRPWEYTKRTVLTLASSVEVLEEWSYDLEAVVTFAADDGRSLAWHARFDFGLLQYWRLIDDR